MSLAAPSLGLLLRLPSALRRLGALVSEINGWLASGHVDEVGNRHVVPLGQPQQLLEGRVPGALLQLPEVSVLASALRCCLERQALPMPSNLEVAGNQLRKAREIHASSVADRVPPDDYPVVYLFTLTPWHHAGFHARLRTMGVELLAANTRADHSLSCVGVPAWGGSWWGHKELRWVECNVITEPRKGGSA
jgi:hypothetical protein